MDTFLDLTDRFPVRFDVTRMRQELADLYRRGGFGYGEVKKRLADEAEAFFAPARERRAELDAHPERVTEVLADGARRARRKARQVLDRVQQACGLNYAPPF